MIIPSHVVLVDGHTAWLLARVVDRAGAAGLLADLHPTGHALLVAARDELDQAGRRALGAADGLPTPLPTPPDPPRSVPTAAVAGSWLTVAAVAELLGVSERRVRQLAHELGAVKYKSQWRFDPESVAEYAQRKAG